MWLLLLHQIPPKPPYLRTKILRRLTQVGAYPVKNSAYLLPETEDTREDFEWTSREIRNEGGAAWLFRVETLGEENLEEEFRKQRTADYEELIAALNEAPADHPRLIRRFEEIRKIDFFEHPLRAEAARLIAELQASTAARKAEPALTGTGRVWVTRTGIKVDRIASAWLIRKFIDPQATFRFVDPATYRHTEGELRFDMYEGEFTHAGDLCTFEVLVKTHQLAAAHPGLEAIAEMVHDIDLKDHRYERPETSGLSRMLDGLCARTQDDQARLHQGSQLFEALLQSFSV
jgi:plasmid stabilization system protein ParE